MSTCISARPFWSSFRSDAEAIGPAAEHMRRLNNYKIEPDAASKMKCGYVTRSELTAYETKSKATSGSRRQREDEEEAAP
jgi:hypothetical protein